MGSGSQTKWSQNHIIDLSHRDRRPVAAILGVLLIVLLVDALLQLTLDKEKADLTRPLDSREELRVRLERAAAAPQQPWLLLGDSVLAGDVMAGKVSDWEEHRIVDYMRAEAAESGAVSLGHVALNGMLPVDMLRIIRELDTVDPGGRVALVIELNPRFFSRHYVGQSLPTRDWLTQVAPNLIEGGRVQWWPWFRQGYRETLLFLSLRLPIVRHHDFIPWKTPLQDVVGTSLVASTEGGAGGELEGKARLLEHYREAQMGDDSAQVGALREIRRLLELRGRRCLFFTTPLNPDFRASAMEDRAYGEYLAGLSGFVAADSKKGVQLVHLDYPLTFPAPLFLDHCHLYPEGNRLLAINLVHEMGLGLGSVPERAELVHEEDPDHSLSWGLQPGYTNGPGWLSRFNGPQGIVVSPEGRIVIADTGNNCLREFDDRAETVSLLAGVPGTPGLTDGGALEATLHSPRSPCCLEESLFFLDGESPVLRRLENGRVTTETSAGPEHWGRVSRIRSAGGKLLLLDTDRQVILSHDPHTRLTSVAVALPAAPRIRDMEVTPQGDYFLLDADNNIHRTKGGVLEPVFLNAPAGDTVASVGCTPFGKMRFHNIVDMIYVERYGGILVQEETPQGVPIAGIEWKARALAERTHLRFLRLKDRIVYPWVKPQVTPWYAATNSNTKTIASALFRSGSMALDQATASLYFVEKDRSRVFMLQDGIAGAAKDTNLSGEYIRSNLEPQSHAGTRIERLRRAGPYEALLLTSSMYNMSDVLIENKRYSLGRLLERRLQDRLGLRDAIRLELYAVEKPGMSTDESIEVFERQVESGARYDVVLIDIWTRLAISGVDDPSKSTACFERFARAAGRYDTLVVFIDGSGFSSRFQEGILPQEPAVTQFMAAAREYGFMTVEPTPAILRESLRNAPWGSPPWESQHANTPSVHTMAELISSAVYPRLVSHLRERRPAWAREAVDPLPVVPAADLLATAVANLRASSGSWMPFEIPLDAVQRVYEGRNLRLFVNLNRVKEFQEGASPALLDKIALSVVLQVFSREVVAGRMTNASVTLSTFSNFDEYGQGIRDSAKVRFERSFDRQTFSDFAGQVTTAP